MSSKIICKTDATSLVISNGKVYVRKEDNSDFSTRAFKVLPGLQLELGRNISNYIEAIKYSRLPIIFKKVVENGDVSHYQIIRMKTGNVDDKIVANIACNKGIIQILAFNRGLIRDREYRRYNSLSVMHQLTITHSLNGFNNRSEQVRQVLEEATSSMANIKITEKDNKIMAILNREGLKLKYTFIRNSNNSDKYELASISLAE